MHALRWAGISWAEPAGVRPPSVQGAVAFRKKEISFSLEENLSIAHTTYTTKFVTLALSGASQSSAFLYGITCFAILSTSKTTSYTTYQTTPFSSASSTAPSPQHHQTSTTRPSCLLHVSTPSPR